MIKKALIAGFINLVVGLALNWLLGILFPSIELEYRNGAIFRPWNDPVMMLFFVYPFVQAFVLVYFWKLVKKELKGDLVQRACQFTGMYLIVATLPGMFVSYTSFHVSFLMIFTWIFTGFIQAFIAGLIFFDTRIK